MSTALDSLYQDIILDHAKRKLNSGLREPYEAEVHHVNPTCGDEVTLRVHLTDGGDGLDGLAGSAGALVADVSYDSMGCSMVASMMR